ncbi:MAG TPA: hypothetical protein VNV36_06160 [Pseudomonas sp.]|uniref:hypothetical protein n=1 Tax=Pseudomonas sp. TaxID=306 RepID=UPI002C230481|nr:hypothetical protein [Pseudomonas sp.]HWH86339.1 hypothetical protein [Pseudomonas sp.]
MKTVMGLLMKLYCYWTTLPPGVRSLGVLTITRYLHGLLRLVMSPLKARLLVAGLLLTGMGALILDGHEVARALDDGQAALEMLLGELQK